MEGLQIQRYTGVLGELTKRNNGDYVLFSDAEKFHTQLQEALGKNMKLTAELVSSRANHVDANKRNMKAQTEVDALTAERDELAKHKKTLGEALRRYGKHDENCGAGDGSGVRCNCGLRNVLRDTGEEV